MPQFDPSVWPAQLFWLAVLFALLVFVMAKFALPPITKILEEREARIDDRLRKAEHLKRDAEEAAAAYDQTIAAARADAMAVVQKVRDEAQAEATRRGTALTEKLQQQIEAAETRIAAARTQAFDELNTVAIDLVSSMTERLIGESFDRAVIAAAVNKVTKEAA